MNNNEITKKGILVYDFKKTCLNQNVINIGDYIQSISLLEIVGENENNLIQIDRENLRNITDSRLGKNEKVKLIINGWFAHNPETFPIDNRIIPFFTSMHGVGYREWINENSINDLKKWGPIGCRDLATVKKYEMLGIESYFSGCLTLSLPEYKGERDGGIVFVLDNIDKISSKNEYDNWWGSNFINNELLKDYDINDIESAKFLVQHSDINLSVEEQFEIARERLEILSKAKLVVTTRIHSLMPSMAKGTKSIFVMTNNQDPRFDGLSEYWNVIDFTESFTNKNYQEPFVKINRDVNGKIVNNNMFREMIKPEIKKIKKFWNE